MTSLSVVPAPSSVPLLRAQAARRPLARRALGAAALVITWLFLWSWLGLGVLQPLSRLPFSA